MSDFSQLGVPQPLVAALTTRGITSPTPIQAATLPDSLAGKDVLGRGRTGSGKTFAFLLPLAARLVESRRRALPKQPRSLILAPTRELASQIEESFQTLAGATGLTCLTIFGGVNQNPQVRALARGVDVLVACPGRLLDLMGQGALDLTAVEVVVIDEADHMADMGFLPMVKRILDKAPTGAQKMLFSATLDNGVDVLVKRYLHQPVVHEADSAESPVAAMEHHVLKVSASEKVDVLADLAAAPGRTIMFTRTKHGAKKLARTLVGRGIPTVELHGNLAQNARTRNMDAFHSGAVETLVATDIAARGIHVDDVELVVHADPPTEHKAYLHRSGRTARAGKAGTVVTLVAPDQQNEVRGLMRAAKIVPTIRDAAAAVLQELAPGKRTYLSADETAARTPGPAEQPAQAAQRGGSGGGGRSRRGGGGRTDGGRADAGRGNGARADSVRTGGGSADSGRPQGAAGSRGQQTTDRTTSTRPSSAPRGTVPAGSSRGAAAMSKAMGGRRRGR